MPRPLRQQDIHLQPQAVRLLIKQTIFTGLLVLLLILALPTSAQEATPEATETTSLTQNARNYCAGQLTYTLPDGWAEGSFIRTGASVARGIASSKATLSKYASLLDPDEASVIIGVFDRKSFADSVNTDEDADIDTLLRALLETPSTVQFTMSDVVTLTVGDYPAARVSGYTDAEYQDAVFVSFDSETLGMVLLSANPTEKTRWNDTVLALAESLKPESVARFPEAEGSLPLSKSFLTSDCSVDFGIPQGWTATKLSVDGTPVFKAWITNYDTPGKESGNLLDSGQSRIELQITSPYHVTADLITSSYQASEKTGGEVVSLSDTTINGQKALLSVIQIKDGDKQIGDALIIALEGKDGSIATLTLYTAPGELDQWRATALAVAASLRVQFPALN
ncbi:MAG: hypothetical protein ABI700_16135 [Chloroflexota bacterium]